MPPPYPVTISHKKDGCQRRPHKFHISRPPYPATESATGPLPSQVLDPSFEHRIVLQVSWNQKKEENFASFYAEQNMSIKLNHFSQWSLNNTHVPKSNRSTLSFCLMRIFHWGYNTIVCCVLFAQRQ